MRKSTMGKTLALLLTLTIMGGCVGMRPSDREGLREMESYGISKNEQAIKNPGLAGALNILPGFGNFYLASGTDESSQWAIGFLNLLTWPISVVWGVPQAAIDASTINEKETFHFYKHSVQGQEEYAKKKQVYLAQKAKESNQ